VETKIWHNFDFVMLAAALILCAFGVLMVQSATLGFSDEVAFGLGSYAVRQAGYAVAGLVLLLAFSAIDYRVLGGFAGPVYAILLLLLGAVFVIGQGAYGSTRWIDLKVFPLQPSELAKIFMIIVLAKFFADREKKMTKLRNFVLSLVLIGIPIGLVYFQPDLGTSLVIMAIWVGMILAVRTRRIYLIGLAGLAVPAAFIAWQFVLKGYMKDRLLIFLHPEQDPLGQGYNIIQAKISIGAGGWFGQGFGHGMQSQLHFLRVAHTDFIFSVISEEFGFLGTLALLVLFVVLLWRIIRVATHAGDSFGQMLAIGVGTMLLFQTFVNIGMNLQLMPVTGIPLPFISYGGNSMLTTLVGLGILQSVLLRHQKIAYWTTAQEYP
jgi:rod shape determining protein RodA